MTPSIMTLSIMALSIMTLSIMTLSIMIFRAKTLFNAIIIIIFSIAASSIIAMRLLGNVGNIILHPC